MAEQHSTVPLYVDHNRPFVDVGFTRPMGQVRPTRVWVDTGGGAFIVTEAVARDLGVPLEAIPNTPGDLQSPFAKIPVPRVQVGNVQLDLIGVDTLAILGVRTVIPGVLAEGLFSGSALARYQVIFDYPHRRFTIGEPGSFGLLRRPVPLAVHPQSGFPRVEIEVVGKPCGMLLDTGASYTMISRALAERWSAEHPEWPRAEGAIGAANMGHEVDRDALMLRVPEVIWGGFRLSDVGVVSRPVGTFEERMAPMVSGPILGATGGNVLKVFRLELQYARSVLALEQYARLDPHDTDLVGIALVEHDGCYTVSHMAGASLRVLADSVRPATECRW